MPNLSSVRWETFFSFEKKNAQCSKQEFPIWLFIRDFSESGSSGSRLLVSFRTDRLAFRIDFGGFKKFCLTSYIVQMKRLGLDRGNQPSVVRANKTIAATQITCFITHADATSLGCILIFCRPWIIRVAKWVGATFQNPSPNRLCHRFQFFW